MIVTADKYEKLLTSIGRGAWGRLDFEGDCTNLRITDVRQLDGYPRIYFDGKREQVVTGVRYQPTSRLPFPIMAGYCYKLTTNVEFVKPIPEGMYGLVIATQDMVDCGIMILSAPMMPGFKGVVIFSVMGIRSVELDSMVVGARLMLFSSLQAVKKPVVRKKTPAKSSKLKGKKK